MSRRLLGPLLLGLLLTACIQAPRPATRPVRTVGWLPGAERGSDRLMVLLPGRFSLPEEFRSEGIEAEIFRALGPVDTCGVDAHPGYYESGSFVETVVEDVLAPARRAGYREIWVVGISLGGSGAIALARSRPDLVDGMILLGPYLGSEIVTERVERYGRGIRGAPPLSEPEDRFFEEEWAWLQEVLPGGPPILLGFGWRDRYAESQRLLARLLPADRVAEVAGGHDWEPWCRALRELLRRGLPGR